MTTRSKLLVFCMPIPVDVVSAVTDVLQPIVDEMELRYDALTGGTALWGRPLEVLAGRPEAVPLARAAMRAHYDGQQPVGTLHPEDAARLDALLVANPEPVDHTGPRAQKACGEDGCDFETDWGPALASHRRTHGTRSGPVAPSEFDDADGDAGPDQQSDTSARQDLEQAPLLLETLAEELEEQSIVDCSECGRPYSRERLPRHLRIDHHWSADTAAEEARA